MIFEGSWWEQLFKAVGGVLVIIGFFSFIYHK